MGAKKKEGSLVALDSEKKKQADTLTADQVKAAHAVAYQEIYNKGLDAGKMELEAKISDGLGRGELVGLEKGKELGASAERARILDVEAQMQPGCEGVIAKCKADGNIDGGSAAKAVIKFQNEQMALGIDNMKKEYGAPIDSDGDGGDLSAGGKDFKTLKAEYKAEHKCTEQVALRACAKLYPDKWKAAK